MAQNYSNIVAGNDSCYKKLYEELKDQYREAASEAKEAESAIADFCEDHATITDNGTYTINEGNSFDVDISGYETVTMTVTTDTLTGIPLPVMENNNFCIRNSFGVGEHSIIIIDGRCDVAAQSGATLVSVSGDAEYSHGDLQIYGDFTAVANASEV